MADGDEKIDHNDRVLVLNRVTDAKTEIQFDGKVLAWAPGELKSIQRQEAKHYVHRSTLKSDPMGTYYPIQRLVTVDQDRQPLEPGASAEPLTAAECVELAKYGVIDTANLPPDRLIGGQMLSDPETGQYPGGIALRGAPKGGGMPAGVPARPAGDRAATDAALDHVG